MRKHLLTLLAAISIAGIAIMQPGRAEARCYGCWVGGGVAFGVLAGAAIASGFGYPAYGYGYGYPAYNYGYYRPVYSGGPYYAYRPRYYDGPRYGYYRPYYRPRYQYASGYYVRPYRYWY